MIEHFEVPYTKSIELATLPTYQTSASAGADVVVATDFKLAPGEVALAKTGLRYAIPDGYEMQIRPRSGLSLKTSLRIANAPGTIDADYRGELGIIVENSFSQADLPLYLATRRQMTTQFLEGAVRSTWREYATVSARHLLVLPDEILDGTCWLDEVGDLFGTLCFKRGERIAQLVLAKVFQADFVEHQNVDIIGTNRGGGFGSTGRF